MIPGTQSDTYTSAVTSHEVEAFIKHFRAYDTGEVTDTFRKGMCYWFAYMLSGRFLGAEIVYEPIEGHFLTQLNGRLYDIRGDVTDQYLGLRPNMYSEEYCLDIPSIVEGCILKVR